MTRTLYHREFLKQLDKSIFWNDGELSSAEMLTGYHLSERQQGTPCRGFCGRLPSIRDGLGGCARAPVAVEELA